MSIEKNIQICSLIDEYGKLLSENQLEIMEEYYFADKSLSEIAENFGISRQAVLDSLKKSEEKLSTLESKLNISEKKQLLISLIENYKNDRITKNDFIIQISNVIGEL